MAAIIFIISLSIIEFIAMAPKIYDLLYHKFCARVKGFCLPFVGWSLPTIGCITVIIFITPWRQKLYHNFFARVKPLGLPLVGSNLPLVGLGCR